MNIFEKCLAAIVQDVFAHILIYETAVSFCIVYPNAYMHCKCLAICCGAICKYFSHFNNIPFQYPNIQDSIEAVCNCPVYGIHILCSERTDNNSLTKRNQTRADR